jgi:ubiquinone/menaquinone biosynthesis C-methylase UbiE
MSDERELFKGTAWYYATYRAGYPKEFFDHVWDVFQLNADSRVLDLGCGTGQVAIPFAHRVREVVGVDPEQDMLDEAVKQAQRSGVSNIRWELKRAEDIDESFGMFDLTTMGASFHWMDQKLVLQRVYDRTKPGGGVVVVSDHGFSPWSEPKEAWQEARTKVLKKYLGEERRAGTGMYKPSPERFEDLFTDSPFGGYEEWKHTYTKTWDVEAAVNFLYSTSFAQRRFFGDKVDDYERELKKELLRVEPSGVFTQQIEVRALIARK